MRWRIPLVETIVGDSRGVFDAFTEPTSASLIVDQSAVLICSGGPAGLAAAIAAARLTRSELRFAYPVFQPRAVFVGSPKV